MIPLWVVVAMLSLAPAAAQNGPQESSRSPQGDEEESNRETDSQPPTFRGSTEVVATRVLRDAEEAGRRQVILTREEIASMPVTTIHEVLALLPGVGLTRRGGRGVQGDLNIRGSTFEQALVLVNGMRVNNAQTGHHNLDFFLPLASIDRIEVLYGSDSAMYGPDAFGGAINIVTSAPRLSAFARFGENDLSGGGFATPLGAGLWVALEREVHTGFRDNTEASVNQLAGGWSWAGRGTSVDLLFSAGERKFGAHAFYSTRFPDEREATAGELLTARSRSEVGNCVLTASLRLDRHRDDFVLDRERPEWYRNRHNTRGALLGLNLVGGLGRWTWAVGLEGARDEISSSNLGLHHRTRTAAFAEAGRVVGPLSFTVQARADHQQPWGTASTWAAGGAWRLGDGWRLRAHHGKSFRVPSFTDLYYRSPSSEGNAELAPERARTAELGIDKGPFSLSLFRRRVTDLIDYVLDDDGVWRAQNLGGITTNGIEAAFELPVVGRLSWQRLGFVLLDSEIGVDPARSAYALAHPRVEASWSGAADLGRRWNAGWVARFRDPQDGGSWGILDCRLGRRILDEMNLSLEVANVFDRQVSELHGIPLPGRWISLLVGFGTGGS